MYLIAICHNKNVFFLARRQFKGGGEVPPDQEKFFITM